MTAFLYYSYSKGLSEDELIKIDNQIYRNRELVYLCITKLPLKRKGKRISSYMRLQSIDVNINNNTFKTAPVISRRMGTVVYKFVRNIPSNVNHKTKRVKIVIGL